MRNKLMLFFFVQRQYIFFWHLCVATMQINETVLQKAIEWKDAQGRRIRSRLENFHDLAAEKAVYHPGYMFKFLANVNFFNDVGKPINTTAFEKMHDCLETDSSCDLYILHNLLIKMEKIGGGTASVYGGKNTQTQALEEVQETYLFQ